MVEYKKENVNDIFRKINRLSEMSDKAKSEDEERAKPKNSTISWDDDGNEIIREDVEIDEKIKQSVGLSKLRVKFKKLDERAVIPTYAHDGDVGMDLTAIDVEYDEKRDMYIYHTGLAFESDYHYGILLFPRSSNRNTDAYLCNHVGIADSAIYRGEIMLCFKNRDSLRQLARETQIVEFLNSIQLGMEVQQAAFQAGAAFSKVMRDKEVIMSLAPYKVGDRVAQMVVIPYPDVELEETERLTASERGEGGFGSTNKKE